jgi:hypothetical protein
VLDGFSRKFAMTIVPDKNLSIYVYGWHIAPLFVLAEV